jgi:hypothetical protein
MLSNRCGVSIVALLCFFPLLASQAFSTQAEADKARQCNALWKQAFAKGELGDRTGAITDYKAVLALCPNNCSAQNNIGHYLSQLGNKAAAISWFEAAVACDPGNTLYRNNAAITKKALPPGTALPPPGPPPADSQDIARFNGAYSGRFDGDTRGDVRLRIQDGLVTGEVYNRHLKSRVEGTVANDGRMECRLEGRIFGFAVVGTVGGYVRGNNADGEWHASEPSGRNAESGSWSVAR